MPWDSFTHAISRTPTWERTKSLHMLERCGPKAVALYHYWNARRGVRVMPGRADIDPLEMRQWLSRITLVDVSPDGEGFTYRLVGTQIVDLLGLNPTGRPVQWAWPEEDTANLLAGYREVVESRAPIFCRQTSPWLSDQEPSAWAMRLPLSSDGVEVNAILGYLNGMLSQL